MSVLNNSRASLPVEGNSNGKELQIANPRPSSSGGKSVEVSPSGKKEIVVFYFHNVVSTTLDAEVRHIVQIAVRKQPSRWGGQHPSTTIYCLSQLAQLAGIGLRRG